MDYKEIYNTLVNLNEMFTTFPPIREKTRQLGDWDTSDEVESLWNTYQQMMRFAVKGVKDSQAERMRKNIIERLGTLTLSMERQERINERRELRYVSKLRELRNAPSLENIVEALARTSSEIERIKSDELIRESVKEHSLEQLEADHERWLVMLFDWLWTSGQWRSSDADIVSNLLFSNKIPSSDKAVIVSAVTLSLLEFADRAKMLFLLDCFLSDDIHVSMRALVGFVLAMHSQETPYYMCFSELNARIDSFCDDPDFVSDIYMVITLLMSSCVTDKVTNTMRQDIMPALMQAHLQRHKKTTPPDIMEQMNKHGENPEWMDDELVSKKVHEMADLQMSGADVYYSSFCHMKGNAFFGKMAHWFYLFSIDSPNVPELKRLLSSKIGRFMRLILNSSPFCDSDKYSICFTFGNIGSIGEDMVESQIMGQLPEGEDLDELLNSSESGIVRDAAKAKRNVCRLYIFDLYRFFYSYPFHPQFTNPFEALRKRPFTPGGSDFMDAVVCSRDDMLAEYADFMMRKEFYEVAEQMFERIINGNEYESELAVIWQKLGFCYQKRGKELEAIHAYEIANSLKPHSKWTLKHLVAMCESCHMPSAAKYCQELLAIEPDNVKYLTKRAFWLVWNNNFRDALAVLHKTAYLGDESEKVKAMLVLCLLMTGENGKAQRRMADIDAALWQDEGAKTIYATALMLANDTTAAYNILASLSADTRDSILFDKCVELVKQQRPAEETSITLLLDAVELGRMD